MRLFLDPPPLRIGPGAASLPALALLGLAAAPLGGLLGRLAPHARVGHARDRADPLVAGAVNGTYGLHRLGIDAHERRL